MNNEKSEFSEIIVQSRDLVNSSHGMGINPLRILLLALAKVDSKEQNPGEITIMPSEYCLAYEVNKRHVNSVLREAIEQLLDSSIKFDFEGAPENEKFLGINWISSGGYDNGVVKLTFAPELEKHLFELKERFVQLPFDDARKIRNPFAFRLLQNLLQYETSPKHKKGDYFEVELSIEQIYKMCPDKTKYEDFFATNARIIKPAVEKLNETQPYHIDYDPVKNGRNVIGVKFTCLAEKAVIEKPVRPRLKKRPKVTKGSSLEGEWARHNFNLLVDYFMAVRNYGDDRLDSITMPDYRKLSELASVIGEPVPKWIDYHLGPRLRKRLK